MVPTIAIVAPGAMGSAVARRLIEHGVRVVTSLAGRSPASRSRAEASGMIEVEDEAIAQADIILSIVTPAAAVALAERLAPILTLGHPEPIFVDCNAIDVQTVRRVAEILGPSTVRFVDGAIIGAPPVPGKDGPTIYLAGAPAADLLWLQSFGLQIQLIDGPIGAASALKMSYAGITKGFLAIGAAMILAASRAGSARPLHAELAASQPQFLKRLTSALPDMYPKAYRWAAEMREISAFVADDKAAAQLYRAAGDFYEQLATDHQEGHAEINLINSFLNVSE